MNSELSLLRKSELLAVILDQLAQGPLLVNADHMVEVCNRRAIAMLDLPPELMKRQPRFVEVLEYQWSTEEFRDAPEALKDFVRSAGMRDDAQCYERTRPNGRIVEVQSVPLPGGGILRTSTDITERRRAEERIRDRARHDGLTRLLNRETFMELVASSIAHATRGGPRFAVHYLDLDRFKPVDDRFGHLVGDHVLTVVAERMRGVARDHDAVARLGGDEFGVLQLVEDDLQPGQLGHRLLHCLDAPIEVEGHRVELGVSGGIAIFPVHRVTADALLRRADAQLYRFKGDRVSASGPSP